MILRHSRESVRLEAGREATPSAAIIDCQSVKTTKLGDERGFDGGKMVKGRKRHVIVDTLGCLLAVVVHAANLYETKTAEWVLSQLSEGFPRLQKIFADQGYGGELADRVKALWGWVLEVVKREGKGFAVLPKRWFVERSLSWLYDHRRLSFDYERLTEQPPSVHAARAPGLCNDQRPSTSVGRRRRTGGGLDVVGLFDPVHRQGFEQQSEVGAFMCPGHAQRLDLAVATLVARHAAPDVARVPHHIEMVPSSLVVGVQRAGPAIAVHRTIARIDFDDEFNGLTRLTRLTGLFLLVEVTNLGQKERGLQAEQFAKEDFGVHLTDVLAVQVATNP